MMRTLPAPALLLALLLPFAAVAQNEEPSVKTDREGTTVVGDRESPIGLYITPWRNAAPEAELDRPARFLEEELMPLDPDVFRRQLEYYNTITEHVAAKKVPAPAAK